MIMPLSFKIGIEKDINSVSVMILIGLAAQAARRVKEIETYLDQLHFNFSEDEATQSKAALALEGIRLRDALTKAADRLTASARELSSRHMAIQVRARSETGRPRPELVSAATADCALLDKASWNGNCPKTRICLPRKVTERTAKV